MSTPREFWVDPSEDQTEPDDIHFGEALKRHPQQGPLLWQYNLIHVIEKTPEVVRKLECFDELVKALEFYADKSNWHTAYCVADEMVFNRDDADFKDQENEYLGKVGGKLARETLKKAKGE